MGTMRHDRTSLWGDPRITADEILDALKEEERRSRRPASLARRSLAVSAPLTLAGGAFVAALGLKVFGLDRAAKLVAWLVPPLLLLGLYDEAARSRVVQQARL